LKYDVFGSPIQATSSTDPCVANVGSASSLTELGYQFTQRDPTTGGYSFGWREYEPSKAAFTTPDNYQPGSTAEDVSIGSDPLTADTYLYANADPINLKDPTGHAAGNTAGCDEACQQEMQECNPNCGAGSPWDDSEGISDAKEGQNGGLTPGDVTATDFYRYFHNLNAPPKPVAAATSQPAPSATAAPCNHDTRAVALNGCPSGGTGTNTNASGGVWMILGFAAVFSALAVCIAASVGVCAAVAPEVVAAGGETVAANLGDAAASDGSEVTQAIAADTSALGQDPATGQFNADEAATAQRIQQQLGISLTRSPDPGVDWVGPGGETYDAVLSTLKSPYFDDQWQSGNIQTQILQHLAKADYVPVDVSGLSPSQAAQVQQYVDTLGPRVFTVGRPGG
jgi:RHS repeat-associated protein